MHIPTELGELGEKTSFDQGVGTEVDSGFALSTAVEGDSQISIRLSNTIEELEPT